MIKLPESDTHFRKFQESGSYQRGALFCALSYVRRYNVAVDVGAHVGFISRDLAPHFKRVYAFEPVLENYRCLAENVPANVVTLNYALADHDYDGCMSSPYLANSGAWQLDGVSAVGPNSVRVRTLDQFDLPICNFLKIDAQGSDYDVLMGAQNTLAAHRPVVLVEMMVDGKVDERIPKALKDYQLVAAIGKDGVWVRK